MFNKSKIIGKLQPILSLITNFAVIDLETVKMPSASVQSWSKMPGKTEIIPYAGGLYTSGQDGVSYKLFHISVTKKMVNSPEDIYHARDLLLLEICNYIGEHLRGHTIFAHNLGEFDGIFLLKCLHNVFGKLDLIMDGSKSIIEIKIPSHNITFRDSLRILNISLNDLAKTFGIPGKLEFDHNTVSIKDLTSSAFFKRIDAYLLRDLEILYKVIQMSQDFMHKHFQIDLCKCYSASHMAMTVFRTKYLNDPDHIHTLPKAADTFVRNSYFGGSVEIFKHFAKNLFQYDVNGLYPHVMQLPMPDEFLEVIRLPDLDDFFGFVYAKVTVPAKELRPVIYIKDSNGENYAPTGNFMAHLFSEEAKKVKGYGYKIKPYIGYKFSQRVLFSKYVQDLHTLKNSVNPELRHLIKLLSNGLYGYFGRSLMPTITQIVTENELDMLIKAFIIRQSIPMSDEESLIIREGYPDRNLCKEHGINLKDLHGSPYQLTKVKTNIAIAAAITSYGRMLMMDVRRDPNTVYANTDAVFTTKKLPAHMMHPTELGKFKLENGGKLIKEAAFIGNNVYGCLFEDNTEKVKASGVHRGLLTFANCLQILNGESINVESSKLIKELEKFTIYSMDQITSLTFTPDSTKIPIFDSNGKVISYKPKHLNYKAKIINTAHTFVERFL